MIEVIMLYAGEAANDTHDMLGRLVWKAIEAADRRGLMPCPSRPAVIANTDFGPQVPAPLGNLGTLRSGLPSAAVAKRLAAEAMSCALS